MAAMKPRDEIGAFPPGKAAAEMKKHFKPLGFRKCANCGSGGLLKSIRPAEQGFLIWCWVCGAKDDDCMQSAFDPAGLTPEDEVRLQLLIKRLQEMGEEI